MPRALLSVSDKTGIVEFARGLAARGYELVSTGGTARALTDAGLTVVNVSEVTGFPEMMDGRVKTLHPLVHGGILARRDHPDDLESARTHGIGLVDVVAVNLYPFEATARKPGVTFDELIENIDIGGPSMVRAAAKNFRDVIVVVNPGEYGRVLQMLDSGPTQEFRFDLMRAAFAHTAAYDSAIAAKLLGVASENGEFVVASAEAPATHSTVEISGSKIRDLRYGENPHQRAEWFGGFGDDRPQTLQGKELSFTNLLDLDAAVRIAAEFEEPAAVVIKHTNPCGVATGDSAADAYVRARDADALAAFGGIVGLNRPLDVPTAEALVSTFIEAVIAPSVEAAAREVLARKANLRVVVGDLAARRGYGREFRSFFGGFLFQDSDTLVEARTPWRPDRLPEGVKVVTRRHPTDDEWTALRFAWRVCAHVKSNAVIFTEAQRTLAIGAGQMSRVDAVNVAVMKARARSQDLQRPLAGSAAASDAFFPFRDGLDAVAAAGATAVVQPGGSVRDAEVIAAADDHDLAMVFTGKRHFRH